MKSSLPVVEIFRSIQGEGVNTGRCANFIRLAGCNLACSFCDTKESWNVAHAKKMTVEEIIGNLVPKDKLVVITGGEPTVHNLEPLCRALRNHGYYIAVETNGTNLVSKKFIDWVTCSPKRDYDYDIACNPDELRYVVDEEFTMECVNNILTVPVYLSPESVKPEMLKKAINLVEASSSKYIRLGVQLHQLIGVK